MQQITIGHLGHFLLDFFAQIWTQGTLRHILGPILVVFQICHFLAIPGLFEYFQKMGGVTKSHFTRKRMAHTQIFRFSFRRRDSRLNHGPICFSIQNTWVGAMGCQKSSTTFMTLS